MDWSVGELKSKVLECCAFEKNCTSVNLEAEVRRIAEKYNITEKIVLDVADNAPDIQKVLSLFGAPKLGCNAHKLNIAAKYAIENYEEIQELKTKLSKIVTLTHKSSNAKNALKDCLKKVQYQGMFCLHFGPEPISFLYVLDCIRFSGLFPTLI